MLCLGLACGIALCRGVLGFAWGRKEYFVQKELSGEPPKALSVFRGLFWAAAAAAVAGLLCGTCFLAWQHTAPLQKLEGEKLTIRAQTLDYPEEQYHRYYYKLKVTALGEAGELAPVEPFTLRLSATMPLAAQPYDWVECDVTFTAFDQGGAVLWSVSPILTALVCMVKGIAAGACAGLVYNAVSRKSVSGGVLSAAVVSPVVNTGLFIVALVVLFEPTLIEWAGLAGKNVVTYILTVLVGINFIIELALNLVLSSVIVRLIKYRMKGVA